MKNKIIFENEIVSVLSLNDTFLIFVMKLDILEHLKLFSMTK